MMQVKRFEFNNFSENTYVVYDETGEAVIIDCGVCFDDEKEELVSFINENNLTLKHILNTHLHIDHAFGLMFMYKKYGLKAQFNRSEEELLPRLKDQAKLFGFNLGDEEIHVERYLQEGDTICFGNVSFKTLLVPGHSPGSLCFYSEEEACLFSGDVIFRGSVGRSDLWGGNHELLIKGIKEKILSLPEDTAVYPGHGLVTTVRYEKNSNPFLR